MKLKPKSHLTIRNADRLLFNLKLINFGNHTTEFSEQPKMASSSQSDTSLWLHNKLGTSNDSWTGGSIVSQLNPDILVKIQHCFMDLQPQVKLKLLLSLFHIGRRNLEAWKTQLDGILSVAKEDSEPWVCMLAELIKTFPETGQLSYDVMITYYKGCM